MKALVTFLVFHPDNYQGGSGAYHEYTQIVDSIEDIELRDLKERVHDEIMVKLNECIPMNWKDGSYILKKTEIFY
jgi:hypothetical protein